MIRGTKFMPFGRANGEGYDSLSDHDIVIDRTPAAVLWVAEWCFVSISSSTTFVLNV
jgi:hypothetical protein